MGWTVLYIAFGCVALWLLGEVLLQYKARLRWRLLAFGGFLGVVIGVLLPSVVVIGIGAIAFATGQTYVTLSFRRGFSTGWALGGQPGLSKRRKTTQRGAVAQDPTLQVSDLEYEQAGPAGPPPETAPGTGVYAPEPLPDDTGQYGIYSDTAYDQQQSATADSGYGYDTYAAAGYDPQQPYAYGETGQQQYAAYSDPYIGTQTYGGQQSYDTYGDQQQYAPYPAAPAADPYGTGAGTYNETPPGGVWVPQQRSVEAPYGQYGGELPPEQPYPYQGDQSQGNGYDAGYDEQYRY
ncbi:hypothetical protein GCM10009837_51580 [Streptomyces durmitorensis]|uniref:Uncharacterized protein n=1 Tax=Streptomyces durmitorensis TaxID=319947 RepID=A0ABY4Q0I6_9ACTN|nr:hypothetical protein [Streptomyces durmitorensis]UQT59054.1 hypothetical protein M4V62_30580 [Streptomyces durmitorensis]